ncbi:MAG: antibiotic biosynthesis monooxygenase [Syntrophus sp. (in: bacteria)]|nr:antibiotic biosynthesis monooxygenase [Syntrophus sp. (in: bacteria)]
MAHVTVVARIKAKPEASAKVREELLKLIEPTLKDDGCIYYNLHQDNEDPSVFIFLEEWENKALLDKHLETAHLKNFQKSTEGLIDERVISVLTKIG